MGKELTGAWNPIGNKDFTEIKNIEKQKKTNNEDKSIVLISKIWLGASAIKYENITRRPPT